MMLSYKALFICEAFLFSFWGRLSKKIYLKIVSPRPPRFWIFILFFCTLPLPENNPMASCLHFSSTCFLQFLTTISWCKYNAAKLLKSNNILYLVITNFAFQEWNPEEFPGIQGILFLMDPLPRSIIQTIIWISHPSLINRIRHQDCHSSSGSSSVVVDLQ